MKKNIVTILLGVIAVMALSGIILFFVSPFSVMDVYRDEDEKHIMAEFKFLPFKKEISGTDYFKFQDTWSPDKKYIAFLEFAREEIYEKEWLLKIFDPRIFKAKTIFIGTGKTSNYAWLNDNTIRVYVNAGSGVRIYRDIDINTPEPFIAADHKTPEYWIPEKTF